MNFFVVFVCIIVIVCVSPQKHSKRSEYAHERRHIHHKRSHLSSKFESSKDDVTSVRPPSTHPWDNPNWKDPLGPVAERKEEFWIDNGQHFLKQRLDLTLNKNIAKNIIIFIGDGMSLTTQMATRAYLGNENIFLSFEKFPYTGLAKTYAVNYQVPDSSNTASAILTGTKTNLGTVGVTGDVRFQNCSAAQETKYHLKTIMKWAQEHGKSTGIVTTTRLTDATPSASFAISPNRWFEHDKDTPKGCDDIAKQLIHGETGRDFKVQLGGGSRAFHPVKDIVHGLNGSRGDNRRLVDEWMSLKSKNGNRAKVVLTRDELLTVDASKIDYLFGIFSHSHMVYHMEADHTLEPTITEMTAKAIEILRKNDNGYVLMVEGGLIDVAHHKNLAQLALNETEEFSKVIQYVKDITDEKDTLLVVTADHSHTLTVGGYPERGNDILEIGGFSRLDSLPFTTLAYANGRSYYEHFDLEKCHRRNPDDMMKHDPSFTFPSAVPYESATHGGEDVAVYANGPWSHLFVGNYEQSYIFHALMYASCMGNDKYQKAPMCSSSNKIIFPTSIIILMIIHGLKYLF